LHGKKSGNPFAKILIFKTTIGCEVARANAHEYRNGLRYRWRSWIAVFQGLPGKKADTREKPRRAAGVFESSLA
jgi:hypothetical protein